MCVSSVILVIEDEYKYFSIKKHIKTLKRMLNYNYCFFINIHFF